ncbi:MAG TPA: hypothetical protein VFF26_11640 [Gallionella sp.]|nr:hypothetical protein [Gallionella sp.]
MMKNQKVLSLAIAAALGLMAANAQATTVTATAPVFAKELFQGSTPAATAITIPVANAIRVVANTAIPANSTVYVYVKLTGASISTIPSVAPGVASAIVSNADGTGAGAAGVSITLAAASLGTTTGTANPAAVGAGVDYIVFKLVTVADGIGVGGTVATIGGAATGAGTSVALALNNAAAILTTPITATASVGIGAPASRFGALPATASNYDATSAATNVASSAQGVTLAAAANTAPGKIDLAAATGSATRFATTPAADAAVSATIAQLGSFTATNGTAVQADGATAYTMASQAGATGLSLTVAAPAGFFGALGTTGKVALDTSATCATGAGGVNGMTTAAFATAAAAAAATSVTIPSTALPTTATAYYVCYHQQATNTVAMVEGTPTLAATLTHTATTTDSNNALAATSLAAMLFNGQTVDVRNYVPVANAGWQNYLRVINTGSVAAQVKVSILPEAGGAATTPVVLINSLAAGAAQTLTPTQIEAAIGAQAAAARPRLRVTAPTNGLEVQNILFTPNGSFTAMQGKE